MSLICPLYKMNPVALKAIQNIYISSYMQNSEPKTNYFMSQTKHCSACTNSPESASLLMPWYLRACILTVLQMYNATVAFHAISSCFSTYMPLSRTPESHIPVLYSPHIAQHGKVCVCVKLRVSLLRQAPQRLCLPPKGGPCIIHVHLHNLLPPYHGFITLSLLLTVHWSNQSTLYWNTSGLDNVRLKGAWRHSKTIRKTCVLILNRSTFTTGVTNASEITQKKKNFHFFVFSSISNTIILSKKLRWMT